MDRPKKYAEHQFIGDKRTQVVYDVDAVDNEAVIDELVESGLSRPVAECVIDTSVDEFGEDRVISDATPTAEEEARIGEILVDCMASAG